MIDSLKWYIVNLIKPPFGHVEFHRMSVHKLIWCLITFRVLDFCDFIKRVSTKLWLKLTVRKVKYRMV